MEYIRVTKDNLEKEPICRDRVGEQVLDRDTQGYWHVKPGGEKWLLELLAKAAQVNPPLQIS